VLYGLLEPARYWKVSDAVVPLTSSQPLSFSNVIVISPEKASAAVFAVAKLLAVMPVPASES